MVHPNHQTWQLEVSSWRIYKREINEYKWLIFCNATFENTKGKPSKINQWDLVSGGFTRFDYLRRKGQPETDVDAWFPFLTIHSIRSLKKHNQWRCRILGNFFVYPGSKSLDGSWRPIFVAMSSISPKEQVEGGVAGSYKFGYPIQLMYPRQILIMLIRLILTATYPLLSPHILARRVQRSHTQGRPQARSWVWDKARCISQYPRTNPLQECTGELSIVKNLCLLHVFTICW